MIVIKQGESFPIPFALTATNGQVLGPDNVVDVMACVGRVSKRHSDGSLTYDEESEKWSYWPSQEETLKMHPETYVMYITIHYPNSVIRKFEGPPVVVQESGCREKI